MPDQCPLTGLPGREVRRRSGEELADAYRTYLGNALPKSLATKYFNDTVIQYENRESGLRWFSPAAIGEKDLYEYLGATYSWYYDDSWDKFQTVKYFQRSKQKEFCDIGCGSGGFLKLAKRAGIHGIGLELNEAAVKKANAEGLSVHLESKLPADFRFPATLTMLQVLEHVPDPFNFAKSYVDRANCQTLIVAVPCYESLLGYTRDPLSWPPHHVTFWSEKAFQTLAKRLGFKLVDVAYQELPSYKRFKVVWGRELGAPLPESDLRLKENPIGSWWHFVRSRLGKKDWACRAHSIWGVFQRA